jgi:hypothetical protein
MGARSDCDVESGCESQRSAAVGHGYGSRVMLTPKGKLFGLQVIEDTELPPDRFRLVNPDGTYTEVIFKQESDDAPHN